MSQGDHEELPAATRAMSTMAGAMAKRRLREAGGALFAILVTVALATPIAQGLPTLTLPVNDFAGVIDPASESAMNTLIRSLQQASGDVVVVATVDTYAPFADIREYAVKLFENGGRGIGQRGKDNGLLVVLAVKERQVWVEVGYDLEQFVTDGFAGETSRQYMVPEFRRGAYGPGLLAGVSRIIGRIAEGRGVRLQGLQPERRRAPTGGGSGGAPLLLLFLLFIVINAIAGRLRGSRRQYRRRWGGGPWSGWHSGVGPFGGGFGGLGGGGGFGGGFGGFGGGRSGGGGGGAGW